MAEHPFCLVNSLKPDKPKIEKKKSDASNIDVDSENLEEVNPKKNGE